jgi:hypothetical protein
VIDVVVLLLVYRFAVTEVRKAYESAPIWILEKELVRKKDDSGLV